MDGHAQIIAMCKPLVERGTKPTLPEVRPIIDLWYALPGNGAGGDLHVELDDGNLENHFLIDNIGSPYHCEAAQWISTVLLLLSRSQRRRL